MNDNAMAQFNTEGQPAFPVENTENENSADSPTEEINNDQTPSQEGEQTPAEEVKDDVVEDTKENPESENFTDHPRWKEREGDWKERFNDQEVRHTEAIEKLRQDFEGKINPPKTDETPSEIPAWFGGSEEEWKGFNEWNSKLVGKVKEDALNEITSKNQAEQKAIEDATSYFNTEIASIESDKTVNPTGEKVDRNKLLKIIQDNELVDTKGNWNYKAGYALMKANVTGVTKNKEIIDEKKQVAAATTSEGTPETKPSEFLTSEDFANPSNRPW